jgi:lactate 2-monooxygenase
MGSMPSSAGRDAQSDIYRAGVSGRTPRIPTSFADLERAARRRMSRAGFAYVAGSAGLERTADANTAAFSRHRIVPRVLRDVSERDLSVELFGVRRPTPLLLAPIGVLDLAHPGADIAAARAAAALGVPAMLSNQASTPMEQVTTAMDAVSAGASRWFQLYWSSSNELVASLIERAERSGCEAIVVTLDTTILGWRPRDLDEAFLPFLRGKGIAQYTSDPVFLRLLEEDGAAAPGQEPRPTLSALATLVQVARAYPGGFLHALRSGKARAAVQQFVRIYSRPALGWHDLAWLRERTRLPILLKGVLHPDDAARAIDAGMDGVVVSNHGGRQVDGAIATLEALPDVVAAVGGRAPVLLDGGVRGGADIFKAVALGARAVLVGRPYV